MQFSSTHDKYIISTLDYRLEISTAELVLIDPRREQVLLHTAQPLLYRPEFSGHALDWRCVELRVESGVAGPATVYLRGEAEGGVSGPLEVNIRCFEDYLEVSAVATLDVEARLAHWHIFSPGVDLDFFHVHHWRSRHGHTAVTETYNLYQGSKTPEQLQGQPIPPEIARLWTSGVDLTTYSTDWHFAPRPALLVWQRDAVSLGIGTRDLPHGFGLEMQAGAGKLKLLRLNYGGDDGFPLAGEEPAIAPRLYLWLDHQRALDGSVDHYVELLQQDGMVPRRELRDTPHWWRLPAYCTWNDQGYLSGNAAYYNFTGERFTAKSPVDAFDAPMLDYLLAQIATERYPFGAVIIDDGWQQTRGDWTPHIEKFPRFREQIDRIHAMGLKAILWLAPFDYSPECSLRRRPEWLCGGGVLGRHAMPLVNYSNPRVREEYLDPLCRFLFSSAPGCLDADGIKNDFMADKIHPVFPIHDRDWRGEERFIRNTMQHWYERMKGIKPDAQMLGSTAHPFFIPCQDLVRTYDVPVSQLQHVDRAEMIRHFNPGNLVTIDLCETRTFADVEEHFALALQHGLLYECGRIAPDPATGRFSVGDGYADLLRRKLAVWK